MREEDALDAMIESAAREEQENLERAHGQHILDAVEASTRAAQKSHPLLEAIARAYQERGEKE
jgi:hypothetical protein